MSPDLNPWETSFKYRSFVFHDGNSEIFPAALLCQALGEKFCNSRQEQGWQKILDLNSISY